MKASDYKYLVLRLAQHMGTDVDNLSHELGAMLGEDLADGEKNNAPTNKIKAVKDYRNRTGVSLSKSLAAVNLYLESFKGTLTDRTPPIWNEKDMEVEEQRVGGSIYEKYNAPPSLSDVGLDSAGRKFGPYPTPIEGDDLSGEEIDILVNGEYLKKILTIKMYRERTGSGLLESKKAVERWMFNHQRLIIERDIM